MATRVPDALMYSKGQESLNKTRNTMIKNQEQSLTGKKINRPSDDPMGKMQSLQISSIQQRDDTVASNLEVATSFLNVTDASLAELSDVLSRGKELALQMSSTSNQTEDARTAVAAEVDQLLMRTVQIGNTRLGDRYVFGGYQMNKAPFDSQGNYFGDAGKFEVEMDRGQRISVNVAGMIPFYGVDEIPNEAVEVRSHPGQDGQPSIPGTLRAPASIEAGNKGIDPKENPDEYATIEKKSGVNVFLAFKNFADGLKSGNLDAITKSVDSMETGFKQVLASRSIVGARLNIVKNSQDSIASARVNNAELKSKAEDADTLQVYSDLAKNETALRSSLEINKKLISPSLLEFLK